MESQEKTWLPLDSWDGLKRQWHIRGLWWLCLRLRPFDSGSRLLAVAIGKDGRTKRPSVGLQMEVVYGVSIAWYWGDFTFGLGREIPA